MQVLVFATSVRATKQVNQLRPILGAIPAIEDWNFDLEDCDNILRIVSNEVSPRYIESVVKTAGYSCVELL